MSKRDLKKYLTDLTKEQVQEQILELYDKFPDVKTYYNFVFNPREDKLVGEAKIKISNEYFPLKGKRPKLRRSVAQKYVKHFLVLGVDAFSTADIMLYNIEVAQKYSAKKEVRYESFYKSMQNSFDQASQFILINGLGNDVESRLMAISEEAHRQNWENAQHFQAVIDNL